MNTGFKAHIVDRYFKCRGGNVTLLDNKPPYNTSAINYWKWLLTVPYTPAPVSRTANLLPLYTLVAGADPALGAAFAAATRYYMCMETNPPPGNAAICEEAAEVL